MEKKVCTKCNEEKELSEYYIKDKKTMRLFSCCKICYNKSQSIKYEKNKTNEEFLKKQRESTKRYRDKNKEKINQRQKEYRNKNKEYLRLKRNQTQKEYVKRNIEKIKLDQKKYRDKNKEKIKEYNKNYRLNNREYIKSLDKKRYEKKKELIIDNAKKYYKNNIEKIKVYRKENRERINLIKKSYMRDYIKNRCSTDPIFKLRRLIKSSINRQLKKNGYTKKSKNYEILGCSYEDFKLYIESKFDPWMSWDNHGLYNGQKCYGWDVDHIIPVSSANTEEDVIRLNHYTNLQPLCSYINRDIKKNSLDF